MSDIAKLTASIRENERKNSIRDLKVILNRKILESINADDNDNMLLYQKLLNIVETEIKEELCPSKSSDTEPRP